MTAWTFADMETGLFSRKKFSGPPESVSINVPAGMIAVEGDHDPLCKRFDFDTGEVIDYQPPKPSDSHEWNGTRWVLNASAQNAEQEDREARAAIKVLEERQHRRVRELLMQDDSQLQSLEAEIAERRKNLKG